MINLPADGLIVHNVFFRLLDRSSEARTRLVASCRQHLPGHDGILFFACGVVAESLAREVNDRDWDVGLHIVFRDLAAHDKYQESDPHHQFIDENSATWQSVRVFDTVAGQSRIP